jgi:hypothetical protein
MAASRRLPSGQMPFRGYWDEHEEDTLRYAVQKHGIGAWERMRHDPEFRILRCALAPAPLRTPSGVDGSPVPHVLRYRPTFQVGLS